MKLAIVQTLYPEGHKTLDDAFVRILAKDHQLVVVDNGKYFDKGIEQLQNVKRLKVIQLSSPRWEALKRCLRKINLLIIFFVLWIKRIEYDQIIFLNIGYDLYQIEHLLPQKKRIIIHHNDIDVVLSNGEFRKSFDGVKDKFYHVCLADYIKDSFIKNTGIEYKHVFTVHQPLVFDVPRNNTIKQNLAIGIGNSLEETFVDEAIELDSVSSTQNIVNQLIIRSRIRSYEGAHLRVIKGFLPRNEYESLYDEAKASVVFYPSNYKYRYSGIIDDSLSKGLIVFCDDSLCGRYFHSVYPKSVRIINDANELWALLGQALPSLPEEEHKLFLQRHSIDFVRGQFNNVILA